MDKKKQLAVKPRKTRAARAVENSELLVNLALPMAKRPLVGADVEIWRGQLNLTQFEAQFALGLRNGNLYLDLCRLPLLPVTTEILLRLYERYPRARDFQKPTMQQVYQSLYGAHEEQFAAGSKERTYAAVDLGARFCRLFDRSAGRQYEWLRVSDGFVDRRGNYPDIDAILGKISTLDNGPQVFEQISILVHQLRGYSIESLHPIPTLANPPTRKSPGRQSRNAS